MKKRCIPRGCMLWWMRDLAHAAVFEEDTSCDWHVSMLFCWQEEEKSCRLHNVAVNLYQVVLATC